MNRFKYGRTEAFREKLERTRHSLAEEQARIGKQLADLE